MVNRMWYAAALLVALALVAGGCGSSETATNQLTAEERFANAKQLFDNNDFLEAINEFTVITLQYQGSAHAADAQFYLGECRFQRAEYLLASFEYGIVKRNYPASPRVADAQYKLALSYYELSPRSSLDPQYTRKAIDEFQQFVEYYPSNPLVADADAKIKELTNRLAKKQYETARLYTRMEYYKAAIVYYDDVIDRYHDTEFAPVAYLDKAELLLGRRRYREARETLEAFTSRFPQSVLQSRADDLRKKLDRESPRSGQAVGSAAPKTDQHAQNGQP
jgi:outer membrane protein assembly factor BamD